MLQPVAGKVNALYRYPVKGLRGEALREVAVSPGFPLPFDRAYAITNGPGPFDPAAPTHLAKIHFLMLMRNEQLAALDARFNSEEYRLSIFIDGRQVASGDLKSPQGRGEIEDFFRGYLPQSALRGPLRIVSARGHSFSDVAAKCVHVVNLESVKALATIAGRPVDPRRFRPNVILEGVEAWEEMQWVGRTIAIGDARFEIFKRTERCAATNVDPETGARDMKIPSLLSRTLGHTDFGIYAHVTAPGLIKPGDSCHLV